MNFPLNFLNRDWWLFLWRYVRGRTPWDTGTTPPEVVEHLRSAKPGKALDLGCGTGTNAVAMAQKGWQVVGIDFIPQAIRVARHKAARNNVAVDFRIGDVGDLSGLSGPFDYALDIGCLHAMDAQRQKSYADGLKRLVRPQGRYMLYAWMPRPWKGKMRGISSETVAALFCPQFTLDYQAVGEEGGAPSAWYWFSKS